MINMCANTNSNTTIVTTLSTQVPTVCRFSTSDALGRGGFEWAGCYRCFGACKPDVICLESGGGICPSPYMYIYRNLQMYTYMLLWTCKNIYVHMRNIHMCACTHVGVHVCMYVCMYVCRHVCVYLRMYVCMHVPIYVWMYACSTHMCTYIHNYRRYICAYGNSYVYVCVYVYIYIYMYVYVCMCVCV